VRREVVGRANDRAPGRELLEMREQEVELEGVGMVVVDPLPLR
jgi:hypothetical protein